MGIYGYALQIYCDFSGYSDMAIGIALLLGFRFPKNFDAPYKSATITEFWRRWFTGLMVLSTLLICYSRIYLGKHYPMDLVWGTAVGIALGLAAFWTYRRLSRPKKELQ